MTAPLQGLRILVVEDEFFIAMLIEDILEIAGCTVAGPVSRLPEALDAARSETCDAAVLDINLAGERIFPVADILSGRNVPFVFVTGYTAAALPAEYAGRPRVCKPFKMADLLGALSGLMEPATPHMARPG
jgi:CheY-like chemotaxis protein